MYRKTYAVVNKKNIYNNVKEIKKKYPGYKYYIGVVKNNAYHHGLDAIKPMLDAGINYLATSSLDEALKVRSIYPNIPILVLERVHPEYIKEVISNNITLTIDNVMDIKELSKLKLKEEIKIHLKIDSGMNRLGFKDKKELMEVSEIIAKNKNIYLEGIYTHFATSGRYDLEYNNQVQKFHELIEDFDLENIPIIHADRSLTFVSHEKIEFVNAVRLGIIMYGFSGSITKGNDLRSKLRDIKWNDFYKKNNLPKPIFENDLKLKTAYELYSEVISVRPVKQGEVVGYNTYHVEEDGFVATISIGYADGVTKDFGYVVIKNKRYKIISDAMDMLMIFCDASVRIGDKTEIFGDNIGIKEVTKRLGINAYHLFNQIQDRVPIIYEERRLK